MDHTDHGGYAKYVEDKVYKPHTATSSFSSTYLEKRVEKLELDKEQTDRVIQQLMRTVEDLRYNSASNKENYNMNYQNQYNDKNTLALKLDKLDQEVGSLSQDVSNLKMRSDKNERSSYSTFSYSQISQEHLNSLEVRIEKALKKQAEDIASDITELERQIRGLQNEFLKLQNTENAVDKYELRRFENYILDRVDTSISKIRSHSEQKNTPKIKDQYDEQASIFDNKNQNASRYFTNDNGRLKVDNSYTESLRKVTPKTTSEARRYNYYDPNNAHNISNTDLTTGNRLSGLRKSLERIEKVHIQELSSEKLLNKSKDGSIFENDSSKNASPLKNKPPIWGNKDKSYVRTKDNSDIVTKTTSSKGERRIISMKPKKRSAKKIIKHRSSSYKKRPRRGSLSSKSEYSQKSREDKIKKSITRVKNLAEKCLSNIMGTSKVGLKSLRVKNKIKDKYSIYTRQKKKHSKLDDKLTKLEKMYQELSVMESDG